MNFYSVLSKSRVIILALLSLYDFCMASNAMEIIGSIMPPETCVITSVQLFHVIPAPSRPKLSGKHTLSEQIETIEKNLRKELQILQELKKNAEPSEWIKRLKECQDYYASLTHKLKFEKLKKEYEIESGKAHQIAEGTRKSKILLTMR
jgi:hypothetical protein